MRLLLLLLLASPALGAPTEPVAQEASAKAGKKAKKKKTKAKAKKGKRGKAAKTPAEPEPLLALARHLDGGVRAWLSGRSMDAALQPWRVEAEDDLEAERARLQELGVARLELVPLEVNLTVADAAGTLFDVRVVAFAHRDRWGILELRSYETPGSTGLPFPDEPTADSLVEAAREVAQLMTSPDCGTTWVPDPREFWPEAPFVERAAKETDELRAELPTLCAAFTGGTGTHFRWDDFGFLARGADDSYKAALEGELGREDGVTVAEFKHVMELPPTQPQPPPQMDPGSSPQLEPAAAEPQEAPPGATVEPGSTDP